MTNNSSTVRGSKAPIWIAGFASVLVLVIAVLLGLSAKPEHNIWPPSNLTANEWGEFIAGVAGILAFIWVIATVSIQSRELELQRLELIDSRRVAREQADFIGRQTALLQQETEERNHALTLEALNALATQVQQLVTSQLFAAFDVSIRTRVGDPSSHDLSFGGVGLNRTFTNIVRATQKSYDALIANGTIVTGSKHPEQFGELKRTLDRWRELSVNLPVQHAIKRADEREMEILCALTDKIQSRETA